jgi:CxxC motif-containing protein (DUF1111 family)
MRPIQIFALGVVVAALPAPRVAAQAPSEAPPAWQIQAGHAVLVTNGFLSQADFDAAKAKFDSLDDDTAVGLGPVYNARTCGECHQNPVIGAVSQIVELRAGHLDANGRFVDAPGGSLINDRAIDPAFQERVPRSEDIHAFRAVTNTIGDGFVEAVDSNDLAGLAARNGGQFIEVPVLEAGGLVRGGRFGWKNQNSSLLTFAGDAYLNEQGITNALFPVDNTSMGRVVDDGAPDPEDQENDIQTFANFMRSTGVPPRDTAVAATPDAVAGDRLFSTIGCDTCHVRTLKTVAAGTVINRGQFTVPPALGNKVFHPFGDFLLHDVGTGDGIVQNGGQRTRNKVRTAPLWGVRTHARLMHDGRSVTFNDAILRHDNEAFDAAQRYRQLSFSQQRQLAVFLSSL